MSSKQSIVVSGIAALAIASVIIIATMFAGVLIGQQNTYTSHVGPVTNTSSSGPSAQGTLSVLVTDPPIIPNGVTKLYITYANLAVHVSESDELHGWVTVNSGGNIELLGTVNVSETIAAASIQSGDYNLIRFNITSAQVTYNGQNFTTFVSTGFLTVLIRGGIEVNNSRPSATIINISPTILNVGSDSNPEFVMRAVASAYPVPSSAVSADSEKVGFKMTLEDKVWWRNYQQQFSNGIKITSASLSNSSFSLAVQNIGVQQADLKMVIISPYVGPTPMMSGHAVMPMFFTSVIFLILPNGTLTHVFRINTLVGPDARQFFETPGYLLDAGGVITFIYTGPIQFGFGSVGMKPSISSRPVPGQFYLVTVMGNGVAANYVVQAH